jgi:serine/threonine protein kinase/DNA-binding SARP family transcriptional activator
LRLFGTLDLSGLDARAIKTVVRQPKRAALLVYLAVARPRGFHRRDRLLSLFWPELDEQHARDALNSALRFLRKAVGADVIVSRGADEVGVSPEHLWCDVLAFESALDAGDLDAALALYDGELLDGFHVSDASGFEEWLESERPYLRERAARAARDAAERHEASQNLTMAIRCARRGVVLSDRDERMLRRLIGLLDRLGDRAGAIEAYEEFASWLAVEYETEPSAETKTLIAQVRARPARAAAGAAPAALEPAVIHPSYSAAHSPPGSLERLRASLASRYAIDREIARGGAAIVYLALDLKHQRRVALKVLRPEIAATVGGERFLQEIRVAAGLHHPHIVPLFDSGETEGLLYYVMPFVEGESLRERLDRERPLSVAESLRIARDVALALDYAHHQGVVHRDIKPENILMSSGEALVTDFGIARAITAASAESQSDRLTETGIAIGTPAYMSPEQASGEHEIDGRSDIYSLACVLFEMLAGEPPFSGTTPHQTLARHTTSHARSLLSLRPDVGPNIDAVVARALAKVPDERFSNAAELAEALAAPPATTPAIETTPPSRRAPWESKRTVAAVMATGMAIVAAWVMLRPSLMSNASPLSAEARSGSGIEVALDTSRYAVLPFEYDSGTTTTRQENQLLRDAIARWSGITVVDAFQMGDVLARLGTNEGAATRPRAVAAHLGAGRYIRATVSRLGDSVRIHAALYDTRADSLLSEHTQRTSRDLEHAEGGIAALADRLLFRGSGMSGRAEMRPGTSSLPARQAYMRAHAAIERWDLALADSELVAATRHDPRYAQAFLWLAQVRSWDGEVPARWGYAAEQAAAGRDRLPSRDQLLADALVALSRGAADRACPLWERLAVEEPHDFAVWYGLGHCLRHDDAVVRDPSTPSGWRFRTSYHRALHAYRRAFELLPSIHRSLRGNSFEPVRELLKTSGGDHRRGQGLAPDSMRFLAHPSWQGDSLLLVPFPVREFDAANPNTVSGTVNEAVKQQRRLFHEIATMWRVSFPRSAAAMEALAVSLQLLGDASALDSIRAARTLSTEPVERLRTASMEVWMRVQFSVPDDTRGLRAAKRIADSLIQLPSPVTREEPRLAASLAALTGRAQLATTFSREEVGASHRTTGALEARVPVPVAREARALLAMAAMGGPTDSLRALEARVARAVDASLIGTTRTAAQFEWLMRAASLAFPDVQLASITRFAERGDYLLDAQAAAVRNDAPRARRILDDVRAARRFISPAELTLDGVYPEAALLNSLGDRKASIGWLDPTLRSIASSPPGVLATVERAGALVRAMALRAQLAEEDGDREEARRWASAAGILWSDADPFLQPLVARMTRLSR